MPVVRSRLPFPAMLTPMIAPDGRNVGVAIAKATYVLPQDGGPCVLADAQEPIELEDRYLGPAGTGPMMISSDLADFKPGGEFLVVRPASLQHARALVGRTVTVEVGAVRVVRKIRDEWPFGPIRRDAAPRKSYAGTYDAAWARDRMPLLPEDFDPRFHLSAPHDQIAPDYFVGDEAIRVSNLYGEGVTVACALPGLTIAVSGNVTHRHFTEIANLDTMLIFADEPKVALVWRQTIVPPAKFEEISNVYFDQVRVSTARQLYGRP